MELKVPLFRLVRNQRLRTTCLDNANDPDYFP